MWSLLRKAANHTQAQRKPTLQDADAAARHGSVPLQLRF